MENESYKEENKSETGQFGNDQVDSSLEIIVIINGGLNAPLILVWIVGNSLLLAAILSTPSIRSISVIMLCSLYCSSLSSEICHFND